MQYQSLKSAFMKTALKPYNNLLIKLSIKLYSFIYIEQRFIIFQKTTKIVFCIYLKLINFVQFSFKHLLQKKYLKISHISFNNFF